MKWVLLLTILFSCLFFTSCDYTLNIKGTVYDNDTKEPLKGVRVTMVVDSVVYQLAHPEFDTVPYKERMEMRKQGIKDDYGPQLFGFGRYVIPYTNDSGKFMVGNMLLKHYRTWKLIFSKDGYKTDTTTDYQVSDNYKGNFKVYMNKK